MKRLAVSLLAFSLITATGAASAQTPYPANGTDNGYYDYARVVRVDPVLQSAPRPVPTADQRCYSEDGYYTTRDDRDDDPYDDRYARDDRYGRDSRDGYYDRDGRWHDTGNRNGSETGRNVATVIGGLVGAALGSKVGGGSARYATAAVGSMVGGMAGREIYESNQRAKQTRNTSVTICDPVSASDRRYDDNATVSGYDVTYEYAGHQYVTRTSHHPGDRIRVRVDVRAE